MAARDHGAPGLRRAGARAARSVPDALTESETTLRPLVDLLILIIAATCEVGGDAMIRSGLRGRGWLVVALGIAVVGIYGLVVNLVPVDFSKLIGVYVAVFAVVGVLFGKLVFREAIPPSTWLGLLVIVAGAGIVQMGIRR